MIYFVMMNPFLMKVILISMLLAFIPTLIALIDILKSRFNQNDKLVWIVVVLFFNLIGAIMYFTIGRKQKIKVELEK
ncbi:PLD nuclease N-terminal domain-containing protein [Nonlabens sp. MB-3u-79]|jgi:4-amino-4-deoxy-L-arabinose transferase-like glycosyltransferase|uniref:PLD nuclease N-terminal domain-containing protein n=2 Tax=Nonlabens TaxID=363408 RepID=UPI0018E1F201|nr:PLD nuclease N-terminal domain-containing protein [Nonlabens sp. MB-3u-79]